MFETIKRVFSNYLLLCLLSIVLGIALVIEPTFLTKLVSYILGGISLGFGVYSIAMYFLKEQEGMVFLTADKSLSNYREPYIRNIIQSEE